MATILNDLALNCGHENYFGFANYPEFRALTEAQLDFFGDSSWLSVPYLGTLPKTCLLLHQVRDPLKTLNSCLASNGGRFARIPPGNSPYHSFAFNNVDTSNWPKENSLKSAKIREQLWWVAWMKKIE